MNTVPRVGWEPFGQALPAGLILSDYLPLKPRLRPRVEEASSTLRAVSARSWPTFWKFGTLAMPYLIGLCHYTVVLSRRKALSTTLTVWRKLLQMCPRNQMPQVVKLSALRGLSLKKKKKGIIFSSGILFWCNFFSFSFSFVEQLKFHAIHFHLRSLT